MTAPMSILIMCDAALHGEQFVIPISYMGAFIVDVELHCPYDDRFKIAVSKDNCVISKSELEGKGWQVVKQSQSEVH